MSALVALTLSCYAEKVMINLPRAFFLGCGQLMLLARHLQRGGQDILLTRLRRLPGTENNRCRLGIADEGHFVIELTSLIGLHLEARLLSGHLGHRQCMLGSLQSLATVHQETVMSSMRVVAVSCLGRDMGIHMPHDPFSLLQQVQGLDNPDDLAPRGADQPHFVSPIALLMSLLQLLIHAPVGSVEETGILQPILLGPLNQAVELPKDDGVQSSDKLPLNVLGQNNLDLRVKFGVDSPGNLKVFQEHLDDLRNVGHGVILLCGNLPGRPSGPTPFGGGKKLTAIGCTAIEKRKVQFKGNSPFN